MSTTQAPNPHTPWIVPAAITLLALADGAVHFALDFVLFHGHFIGSARPAGPPPPPPAGAPAGPPPGAPPISLPLPLNELFLLNAVGYVGLVAVYWLSTGWLPAWRWLVDAVMVVYTALSIAGWLDVGRPNPNGLGYLSKAIEVVLIVLLLKDAFAVLGQHGIGRRERSVSTGGHPAV
ncbi:MAG TPA: hypothetical protein VK821_09025 [Dehalococcoidia bacterium]|nr:hypothetical protein [Dehalococcoidia bacterium]